MKTKSHIFRRVLIFTTFVSPMVFANPNIYGVMPSLVRSETSVTITLPKKHPAEFAVMRPSGTWIYVVDKPTKYSYFQDFEANTSWIFPASDLKGIEFKDDGTTTVSKVFSEKGKYLFYFADNTETEPENTFSLSYSVSYSP